MIRNTFKTLFSRFKGLLLFICHLIVPVFFAVIIIKLLIFLGGKYYNNQILDALVKEKELIYLIVMYGLFFLFYESLKLVFKTNNKYFSDENWFHSLGSALIPAITAFGLALVILAFISSLINLLPDTMNVKKSLVLPNKALVDLLDYINIKASYKIVVWLTFIILVAPIYEEILFRGFLQDFIEKFIRIKNLDLIIVSLLFALFHLPSFTNAVYAFIIGIFLSIQRKKDNSINVCVWMHSIINFAGVILAITYQYLASYLNVN